MANGKHLSRPLSPRTPLLPALRSGPTAVPGASRRKQIPSSPTDYDIWAASHNLAGGHSLTNFFKYAFGLNPNSGSSVSPVAVPDKSAGTFTYTRRKPTLAGLTYHYEYSTNLVGWNPFTPAANSSDNGDPVETITATIPAALLAEPTFFLRVAASE